MSRNAEMPGVDGRAFQKSLAAGGGLKLTVPQPQGRREMRATPGWPAVAIPGRPGWWRHCIDGQQVDLPHNNPQH